MSVFPAAIIDDHYFGEAQTLIALLRFMAPSFQELSLVGCRSEPLSQ